VEVVRQLTEAGFTAYWAGGCVRDLLRGEDPNDYDVATNATPEQVRRLFGRRRTVPVGESFGVIIVLGRKEQGQIEVATFRTEENYADGRRPEKVAFCSPEEDAFRRDFTINGMFYDPLTETVHDFVGGQADLEARVIRAIGEPHDRMNEDKLRMLRAVRFASVLDYSLDEATARAVADMAHQIVVVSAERIAQELRKMLQDRHRARAVRLCRELQLLEVILPEVIETTVRHSEERWQQVLELLARLGNASFETALAALLRDVPAPAGQRGDDVHHGTVRAACRRLKLSNLETGRVCWLSERRGAFDDASQMSTAELKRLAAEPGFRDLLHLERTAAAVEGKALRAFEFVDVFLERTPPEEIDPPPLVTGSDLIQLGLSPGPRFKALLTALRDAQLNGEISTHEEALELARQLAATDQGSINDS
jgi:poly(A) polymerase